MLMLLLGRFLLKERLIRCALYYFSNGIKADPVSTVRTNRNYGEEALKRVIYGEAPLRCPIPYPYMPFLG